jgi:hypothetical protein
MTTKHRFRNKYRLQLREKDHNPVHVHLVGGEINVSINLETLCITKGVLSTDLRDEVMTWLSVNRDKLIEEWKELHE